MNFYKITARINQKEVENIETAAKKYREYTEDIYQKFDEKAVIAVEDTSEFTCTLIAVIKSDAVNDFGTEELVSEFNKMSELDLSVKNVKEISLSNLIRFLGHSERKEYIEDRDKIIMDFKLDCGFRFREFVSDAVSKEMINERSQELLYDKSLNPEIERIYQIKNNRGKLHHPVHYIIRSDNDEEYREIIDCLISALYENNRLFSKRYSEVEIYEYANCSRHNLTRLYTIQQGAAVVLKIEPSADSEEDCGGDSLCEYLERISYVVNKFNQDVLTILVMPSVCEKATEAIYKNITSVFVEISPENASGERAKKYLAYKAKKAEVKVTDTLFKSISAQKAMCAAELSELFNEWYSYYIRTEMYPQYAEMKQKKISENDKRFGKALKDLDEMIGLANAKKIIYNALDYYKVQKMYKQFGRKTEAPSMHMVFTGNPGTAKTTVARLFAQILKDNDTITNGRLIEVGRADLVGKYIGHTAPLVRKAFERAEGGVLFIDEAYSLLDDRSGMYGDEAINTIVQEMENRRNETIVIFAGYPKEMEEFLNRNPGLKSRIAFNVPFEDYSPQELVDITKLMAKNKEYSLTEEAVDKLSGIYAEAVKIPDFGNGRYARNVIEKAEINRASRLARLSFDEVTVDMLEILEADDFEEDATSKQEKNSIGFIH